MKKKKKNASINHSSSTTRLRVKKDKRSFELNFSYNKFAKNRTKAYKPRQTSPTTSSHSSSLSPQFLPQKGPWQTSFTSPKSFIAKQVILLFTVTPPLTLIVAKSLSWFVTTSLAHSLGLYVTQDQINIIIEKILDVLLQVKL